MPGFPIAVALKEAVRTAVPAAARLRLSRWLRDVAALPRLAQLLSVKPPPGTTPAVYYGRDRVPGVGEIAYGGLVKLQGLAAAFPNSPHAFNTLYLVSSALPAGATTMAWLARSRGARVVLNQDGVASPAWPGPGWRQVNAALAVLLRRADHVLYQSEFCKRAADRFLGPPRGSWQVLHNAVDTERFQPGGQAGSRRGMVLLLGGNQDQLYRVVTALGVIHQLLRRGVDARLRIAGQLRWGRSGHRAAAEAERKIQELGLAGRVEFLGPYSQSDAPQVFHGADLLLHTKANDPCPGVVIEAMACGLPVVYSASGGVPELVGEEAGIGVPAQLDWEREIVPDASALAEATLAAWERRDELARAARRRAVERFDIRNWLERHREVLSMLQR